MELDIYFTKAKSFTLVIPKWRACQLFIDIPAPRAFKIFIYLFIFGCIGSSLLSGGERGPLFDAVRGLLIAVASLVAEHGL